MIAGEIMILWFKKTRRNLLYSQSGSALPVVLMFAAAGLITVISFLYFHLSYARNSLGSSSTAQAFFNARSGIYKGFEELTSANAESTVVLPVINTLDPDFSKITVDPDTSIIEEKKLTMDGGTVEYHLYSQDSLVIAKVSLIPDGGSCVLQSIGTNQKTFSKIEATLGSKIPAQPDTVAICYNISEWEDGGGVRGTKISRSGVGDTASPWLRKMISKYQETVSMAETTAIVEPPLIIQTTMDLKKIPTIVNGDLLIDGSPNSLVWKDTGSVTVLGRMDVSNEVTIEGLKFIVAGEITLSGKARLSQVSLFSQSKIFFGDNSCFEGNAMALNSVAIYGNASIENKSTIIVCGSSVIDSTSNPDKGKKIYSIEIGDKAVVDGIMVALGSPGDIKTHSDVKITGIMIAQKSVGHLGKMAGLICAAQFIDPDASQTPMGASSGTTTTVAKNVIRGDLEPLIDIDDYKLPFFLGKLIITKWKEY